MSNTPPDIEQAPSTQRLMDRRGVDLRGRSIRQHAARGTIINGTFTVLVTAIALARGLLLARFLTRADYGIWGILAVSLGTLTWLKQIGIGDKYLQQDEEDQELAFQQAFTIECIVNGAFILLLLAAVPAVAAIYGRSELLLPGFAISFLLIANVLTAPAWVFGRRLRWGTQRLLQGLGPVVGTVVALALAIAGAGYWALLAGVISGAWATAVAAIYISPYPLRFRLDRRQLRSYLSFSWPLFIASGSSLLMAQAAVFFGNDAVGLAGLGAMTLAMNVSAFAWQVDAIVSGTMYPVICAIQRRVDLLFESFVKSNRVALIWAMPFGVGLALFASDLVHYG